MEKDVKVLGHFTVLKGKEIRKDGDVFLYLNNGWVYTISEEAYEYLVEHLGMLTVEDLEVVGTVETIKKGY